MAGVQSQEPEGWNPGGNAGSLWGLQPRMFQSLDNILQAGQPLKGKALTYNPVFEPDCSGPGWRQGGRWGGQSNGLGDSGVLSGQATHERWTRLHSVADRLPGPPG